MEKNKKNNTTTVAKKKTLMLYNLDRLSILGDVLIIIFITKSLTSDLPMTSLEYYLVIIISIFGLVVSILHNREIERATKRELIVKKKKSRLLIYLDIALIISALTLFISTPPDASKPANCIIIITIGGFWLAISVLIYYDEKKHSDK